MREFKTIEFSVDEHIAVLTINRPRFLNALNTEVLNELSEAIDLIDQNASLRVVIVTGAGEKAFVAGADLSELQSKNIFEAREFSTFGNNVFSKLENLRIPVIAAVNGFALGGGCELAMACDIRIASTTAKFGQPEVGLGLMAGFGGTRRLARLVGKGIANEMLFTGDMIDAKRAYEIGLVNRLVEPSEVLKEAKKLAEHIAIKSPLGVSFSKKAVNESFNNERAINLESQLFGYLFSTKDTTEGITAFLEKRKVVFKGQ